MACPRIVHPASSCPSPPPDSPGSQHLHPHQAVREISDERWLSLKTQVQAQGEDQASLQQWQIQATVRFETVEDPSFPSP
jgi:hypothetical protein